jgi:glycogen debranching enzyme
MRIEEARAQAEEVIAACARTGVFYASGLDGGYEAVWARDNGLISLGAVLCGERFRKEARATLDLLAKHQSANGQVPNCVGSWNIDRRSSVTFNSIDSSLWFILAHYFYSEAYDDRSLFDKHKQAVAKALVWLRFQDPNEDKLLAQQPTMDWMDAFPHKYGRTINTHALYYGALKLVGKDAEAEHIKKVLNGKIEKYLALYDPALGFYWPWAWKNHDGIQEHEEWFDASGNVLAILSGLADRKIAESIISYIDKAGINRPYPLKALWPAIQPGDAAWHDYFEKCNARDPLHYLNGGIWPWIGGIYVAALVRLRLFDKAEEELARLAEGLLQPLQEHSEEAVDDIAKKHKKDRADVISERSVGFNEWLQGRSGEPLGEPYQGWSAGAYIYAYECLKAKRAIFFEY